MICLSARTASRLARSVARSGRAPTSKRPSASRSICSRWRTATPPSTALRRASSSSCAPPACGATTAPPRSKRWRSSGPSKPPRKASRCNLLTEDKENTMKALALRIEPQALIATSMVNPLKAERCLPDLDAVEAFLKRKCTAHTWLVTRGGSHVALVEVNAQAGTSVRRAMIAESTDKDDVFEYAEVRSEIRRIEEDARRAADLRDAPAGSGNLRTALLEA